MTVENANRRRQEVYYHYGGGSDLEDKQREAEEYQAARSDRPMSLTTDALMNAKHNSSNALGSDSGSQKSRSSRGSDRTQSGSARSRTEDEDTLVMNINGVTMSFPKEAFSSKVISLRRGETGEVELNIAGRNGRNRRYIPGRSDYSGGSGGSSGSARREIEDTRHSRDERRSDRRRSSRSTYGSR